MLTTSVARTALEGAVEAARPAVEALERDREAERAKHRSRSWSELRRALRVTLTAELGEEAAEEAMDCTSAVSPDAFDWNTEEYVAEFRFDAAAPVCCVLRRRSTLCSWALEPYREAPADAGPGMRSWWYVRGATGAESRWASTLAGAVVLARLLYRAEDCVGF